MKKSKPCPARIWSLNGKRVDIKWNDKTKKWDQVRPIPEGAIEYFCDGDEGHEGTCCGSRTRQEYERLGGK